MISVKGLMLSDFSNLINEIDKNIHKNIDPTLIQAGSNTKLSWICIFCRKSYQRCPNQRTRNGSSCPDKNCVLKKRSNTIYKKFGWNSHYDKPKVEIIENRTNSIKDQSENDIEEWRDLPKEMQLSKYQVSSLGRIKNNKRIFSPKTREDGYINSVFVLDDKKKKSYYYHVLIAKTFIENPEGKLTVNHINTIKDDNRVINLEWCTHSEQNLSQNKKSYNTRGKPINQLDLNGNFIKRWEKLTDAQSELKIDKRNISSVLKGKRKKTGEFKWEYCDIDIIENEIWKRVLLNDFEEIYASNYGRIKKNNVFSYGTLRKSGYYEIKIKNIVKNKYFTFRVHRLICIAFTENVHNKEFVNHKDLNRSNNKLENLEWITNKENVNHQLDLNNREKLNCLSKDVLQIDIKTGYIIKEFNSVSQASKLTGFANSGINLCCNNFRNTKSCGGFAWKFKVDYNKDKKIYN